MGLTLQFVPYNEIKPLSSIGRIKKLLNVAKQNKVVLLEGRLKKEEEAELIKTTMEEINEEFKGIELAVIYPGNNLPDDLFNKLKVGFIAALLGNRMGLTVIGPASIIKEIKHDPDKIQLFTRNNINKPKSKKRLRKRR